MEDGIYIEFPRLKCGDGKTKLNDLPFIDSFSSASAERNYIYYNETLELI